MQYAQISTWQDREYLLEIIESFLRKCLTSASMEMGKNEGDQAAARIRAARRNGAGQRRCPVTAAFGIPAQSVSGALSRLCMRSESP
jgi:hypothetical protein